LGAPFLLVDTEELDDPDLIANTPDRCYFCKRLDLRLLKRIAAERGMAVVALGANVSDLTDYRPGARASAELGARSPLQEAGLTKPEIRALSKQRGLPTWNKPSNACLASRIPYGTAITKEALLRVDAAETYLREHFGIEQLRVRDHGAIARIEVEPNEIGRLAEETARAEIVQELRRLGYRYVTLDLQGFRSGSMNEVLPE
jgi:pyridinium-3,5-biscarboxylic acid mononucleotide sulfurtransferase